MRFAVRIVLVMWRCIDSSATGNKTEISADNFGSGETKSHGVLIFERDMSQSTSRLKGDSDSGDGLLAWSARANTQKIVCSNLSMCSNYKYIQVAACDCIQCSHLCAITDYDITSSLHNKGMFVRARVFNLCPGKQSCGHAHHGYHHHPWS